MLNHKLNIINPKYGNYIIKGEIRKKNTLILCRVAAYNRDTGELICKSHSNNNGRYVLLGLKNIIHSVVAFDPEHKYNLATQDNVKW